MGRSFGSGIDVSNDTAISLLMHVHGIWWQNTVSFGRASRYGVLDQNTMGTHAARCRGCLKCTSRMWVHQNCRSVHLCTFRAAISRPGAPNRFTRGANRFGSAVMYAPPREHAE